MRKFCKLFLLIGIFLCSSLLFVGCDDDLILVTGVDLYKEELYVNLNDAIDLSYKVYPSNATNQKVSFWSTDDSVASVDKDGKVTVKAYGEASIVIRSLDGGFEDSCKIITNIDPEEIRWDTKDGKLTAVEGESYSATSAMALNQVMKLKIDYLIDEVESDLVTNKNVKFTSSNTSNIAIINESEGIIKAINNQKTSGDMAYSDITASVETTDGVLAIKCRVYINEFSSQNNLYLNYKNYNTQVLNLRNGSETIYLTAGGESVEFYAYITNMSNDVKTDYSMSITPSDDAKFEVEDISYDSGWYFFKLTPSAIDEGAGTLYINTTCSDENGKTIRCSVNVVVQAEIAYAKATATERKIGEREILLNGEIFSIDLSFYDSSLNRIVGAKRDIYFEEFDSELLNYISNYGNNKFKVKNIPNDPTKVFTINGYFFVENVETSARKDFTYSFYLRNKLEGVIVSETPKQDEIPSYGISSITIPVGGEKDLFVYSASFDFKDTQPSTIEVEFSDALIAIDSDNHNLFRVIAKAKQGTTTIIFKTTDGEKTIEYEVVVNIVAQVAEIKLYRDYIGGSYSSELTNIVVNQSSVRVYFDILPTNADYKLGDTSKIRVVSSRGVVSEEYDHINNKLVRFIEISTEGLLSGQSITITIESERVLASTELSLYYQAY